MIFMWLFGDIVKMVFLVMEDQPIQFILGNCFVMSVQLGILAQFVWYRNAPVKADPAPTTNS